MARFSSTATEFMLIAFKLPEYGVSADDREVPQGSVIDVRADDGQDSSGDDGLKFAESCAQASGL